MYAQQRTRKRRYRRSSTIHDDLYSGVWTPGKTSARPIAFPLNSAIAWQDDMGLRGRISTEDIPLDRS
jgi:hypothetical protein